MRTFSVRSLLKAFSSRRDIRPVETGYHAGGATLTRLHFDIIMNSIFHFVHGHREHEDGNNALPEATTPIGANKQASAT